MPKVITISDNVDEKLKTLRQKYSDEDSGKLASYDKVIRKLLKRSELLKDAKRILKELGLLEELKKNKEIKDEE
ncbi:MAG: hypothetical protein PHH85_10635 [Candidatus Methanoperedens sp.]|nr:hypothetical protein [Candidatus Methanoperedens sp.]